VNARVRSPWGGGPVGGRSRGTCVPPILDGRRAWGPREPGYPIHPAAPGCASRGGLFGGRASRDRSADRLGATSAGPPRLPRDPSPERDEEKRSQLPEWRSVAATAGSAEQSARAASRERVDMTERGNREKRSGTRSIRVCVSHVLNTATRVPEGGSAV